MRTNVQPAHRLTQKNDPMSTTEDVATMPSLINSETPSLLPAKLDAAAILSAALLATVLSPVIFADTNASGPVAAAGTTVDDIWY